MTFVLKELNMGWARAGEWPGCTLDSMLKLLGFKSLCLLINLLDNHYSSLSFIFPICKMMTAVLSAPQGFWWRSMEMIMDARSRVPALWFGTVKLLYFRKLRFSYP
jgi:hypothetical protein